MPSSIVDFVAAHLQLKSTLDRAKAEMDAAGKAAQAEARAKKLPAKKEQSKVEPTKAVAPEKLVEAAKLEPPKIFGLFDAPVAEAPVAREAEEEAEILAEANANDDEEEEEDFEEAA